MALCPNHCSDPFHPVLPGAVRHDGEILPDFRHDALDSYVLHAKSEEAHRHQHNGNSMSNVPSVAHEPSLGSKASQATHSSPRPLAATGLSRLLNGLYNPDSPMGMGHVLSGISCHSASSARGDEETRSVHTLDDETDPDLLVGVRLERALANFGSKWQASAGGGIDVSVDDYLESERTEFIDDFISHDWHTGRLEKFMTLCLIYNGPMAVFASSFVSSFCMVLQMNGVLTVPVGLGPEETLIIAGAEYQPCNGIWCTPSALLVYVVCLFFGRRICALSPFGRPRLAFVDRFCINQNDEAKKIAGVLGLAGFMKASSRLVILWSGKYFTRLWCTFEIASWLHLRKLKPGSILLMPVQLGLAICTCAGFMLVQCLLAMWLRHSPVVFVLVNIILAGVVFPFISFRFHTMQQELRSLHGQFKAFSFNNAACYCCSVKHRTACGKTIPCDRKMVLYTLNQWFRSSYRESFSAFEESRPPTAMDDQSGVENLEAGLDGAGFFDELVRTRLAPIVLRNLGSNRIPYYYTLFPMFPLLWSYMDTLVGLLGSVPVASEVFVRRCFEILVICFAVYPVGLTLCLQLLSVFSTVRGLGTGHAWQFLVNQVNVVVTVAASAGLWSMMRYSASLQSVVPQLLASALALLVTVVCFNRGFVDNLWRRGQQTDWDSHSVTSMLSAQLGRSRSWCSGSSSSPRSSA
eukprot:TRINITY_DN39330_c0_g4_i1.p1 TRINITY_DN39330_c0_g4~~TRINITY_DN39330_c0_g4_i1.p1  ORF type:complete len:692 (+),score=75.84 TRINITY_DN39330_c0_g4_i1:81-2156(+)